MHALILAGGLGTRLRGVVDDVPKPMAEVGGRAFLEHLLLRLRRHGVDDVVLSTGHLGEVVRARLGDGSALGLRLAYSHEEEPLGTGGALKLAEGALGSDPFLVLNGDSFLDADLGALGRLHAERGALVTMALAEVDDRSRYGAVELADDGSVRAFVEKGGRSDSRLVNGGIYALAREVLDRIPAGRPVSLEREVFPALLGPRFLGLRCPGFFIDIGVPDDLRRIREDPSPLL